MALMEIKRDRNNNGVVFYINGKIGFIDKKYNNKKGFEKKILNALDGKMTLDVIERLNNPYLYIQDLPIVKIIVEKKVYFLEPVEENWFFDETVDMERRVNEIDFNKKEVVITVPKTKQMLHVRDKTVKTITIGSYDIVYKFEDILDASIVNDYINSMVSDTLNRKYTAYKLSTNNTSVFEKYTGINCDPSTDNIIKYITNNGLVDRLVDAFIVSLDKQHILNDYKYGDNLEATITALNPMSGEMETCEVTYTLKDIINNIDMDIIFSLGYPHIKEEGWIKDLI